MITQFNDYSNQLSQDQIEFDHVIVEPLNSYDKNMMIFENYWSGSIFNGFNNQTVKPFLVNISQMIGEPVNVGHRYISSKEDLQYYLKTPGGMIWNLPDRFNLTYFGFHGSHLGLTLPQGLISKDDLIEMCSGFYFPTLLYFSSCDLFEDDDQFGHDLLNCGKGIRGVIGYKTTVPFTISMIIDILFTSFFYLFKDGDPLDNLETIFTGVVEEIPISKELGYTLYC
jgi:hypothetical protein